MKEVSDHNIRIAIYLGNLSEMIPDSSETIYLCLFGLYISTTLINKIRWSSSVKSLTIMIRLGMVSIALWGSALYFFDLLLKWLNNRHKTNANSNSFEKQRGTHSGGFGNIVFLTISGVGIIAAVFAFSRFMTLNSYTLVMDICFCALAYRKNYIRILQVVLMLSAVSILFGLLGVMTEYADNIVIYKPDRLDGVCAYGIIHPNILAEMIFMILLIIWYLYLKSNYVITVVIFWASSWIINTILSCKTVSLLMVAFPIMSIGSECFCEKSKKEKPPYRNGLSNIDILENGIVDISVKHNARKSLRNLKKFYAMIMVNTPFIFFAISLFLCWPMKWIRKVFYPTGLLSFAMRFVEGGYALRQNGIPLFGHEIYHGKNLGPDYSEGITNVVDNAFIYYLIRRGLLWIILCLFWLLLANIKCLKNKDHRLLLISICMLILAMMEHCPLEMWYNVIFLYPLATAQPTGTNGKCVDTDRKSTA